MLAPGSVVLQFRQVFWCPDECDDGWLELIETGPTLFVFWRSSESLKPICRFPQDIAKDYMLLRACSCKIDLKLLESDPYKGHVVIQLDVSTENFTHFIRVCKWVAMPAFREFVRSDIAASVPVEIKALVIPG